MTSSIEDTWTHSTAEIPTRGLVIQRSATAEECAALARRLEIPGVERLSVDYRISPQKTGRFALHGRLVARVTQSCVVTLDPVSTDLAETIDVEFRPPSDMEVGSTEETEALSAAEHEPIEHQRIAVGRVVAETLAAALPAYPRAADASLDHSEAGPADDAAAKPFAALANWKPEPR